MSPSLELTQVTWGEGIEIQFAVPGRVVLLSILRTQPRKDGKSTAGGSSSVEYPSIHSRRMQHNAG